MTKEGAFMRYLSRIDFEVDSTSDGEIDELFSQLEQFEPPADFVDLVMAKVSRLPLPQCMPTLVADHDECLVGYPQHVPPAL
jgi:hypothetical protein